MVFEETPLTQGGPGLPGALRSMIGAHPDYPSLARQPRRRFDAEGISELADSVRALRKISAYATPTRRP